MSSGVNFTDIPTEFVACLPVIVILAGLELVTLADDGLTVA